MKESDSVCPVIAALYARDPAPRALGMEVLQARPGYARLRMQVREDMLNGHGMGHGGFIFSLADTAFAYACNAANRATVGQHCSITYLQPAMPGETLYATCEEVDRRGRSGIYDVQVTNAAGAAVALFRGHCREIGGAVVAPEQLPAS